MNLEIKDGFSEKSESMLSSSEEKSESSIDSSSIDWFASFIAKI